ncbi:hypothetical protein CEK25_003654 [Fusarium fujikuroi]|nr:hypothetical protein CEK25_003654 [Fusarium fujikuroi]
MNPLAFVPATKPPTGIGGFEPASTTAAGAFVPPPKAPTTTGGSVPGSKAPTAISATVPDSCSRPAVNARTTTALSPKVNQGCVAAGLSSEQTEEEFKLGTGLSDEMVEQGMSLNEQKVALQRWMFFNIQKQRWMEDNN